MPSVGECSFYSFIIRNLNNGDDGTPPYPVTLPIHIPSLFPEGPALREAVDMIEEKTGGVVQLIVRLPHPPVAEEVLS